MALLPTSRNTSYAPGVQVQSVDLNDIQDQIIAGGHGWRYQDVDYSRGYRNPAGVVTLNQTTGLLALTAAGATIELDLALPRNAYLRNIRARALGVDGTSQLTMQLGNRNDATTTPVAGGAGGIGANSGIWSWVTLTYATPVTRSADQETFVVALQNTGATSITITKIAVEISCQ